MIYMRRLRDSLVVISENFNINMKKILIWQFIAFVLIFLSGCVNDESLIDSQVTNEDVNIAFYDIYMEEIGHVDSNANTRVTALNKVSTFKTLTVALFPTKSDSVYRYQQNSTDSDYGSLSVKLPIDKYVLVAVASAGPSVEIVSPTEVNFPNNHVKDHVYVCDTIEVKGGASNTIVSTMKRALASLQIIFTNKDVANLSKISLEIKGNCSAHLCATDGFSTVSEGYSRTMDFSSSVISAGIAAYVFLCSDQENVDVTVKLYDTEGNLCKTKEFTDVVLRRNYVTTYTGDLVSLDKSLSFQVEEETMKSSGYDKTFDN